MINTENGSIYSSFAQVYDIFMDNVPYKEWADYVVSLLKEYGIKDGLVLELACGTGKITRQLADTGYDMIGIDYSEDMLEIARENEYDRLGSFDIEETGNGLETDDIVEQDTKTQATKADGTEAYDDRESGILYLQQDMRAFELFGTVSAVVCICDGMNYITSEEDLLQVFKLVNNYLDPSGLFIFDMNTEYKYKKLLGDSVIAENRENCSFIWENFYDEESKLNEYNLTLFIKLEDTEEISEEEETDSKIAGSYDEGSASDEYDPEDGEDENRELFERYQETHYQKAYSIEMVKELLEKAGMEFVTVYDAFTQDKPHEKSERVYFIAREKYQENKSYVTGV
ncbi:hypothetical protein acsn021_37910 [Anaerocolumna cellulosilytica]|uniref:Uncharacterized protein n=1 Tax=Anaerocolumna cellulosilytica TaxID=433286 RepID=A0A6S6RAE0_9FIRM|nr:class I SAM-dependent methyltransferase [Anaerocolumna cellulosilytica]MBB5194944.1 SAM-dependent methyltransferase [Anaerocolumna cellulosilytica]BCJ96222.1 hypothetical protein acsn021_37910 [Anaerocolumna cellulosilytica]